MKFKEYLDEAVQKVEELDIKSFFTSTSPEVQAEFIQRYVQHRDLDARKWFPFLRMDGEVINASRLHFGDGRTDSRSIIKKALYEDGYRPLISDNAIAGMFRIPLLTLSRQIWGDDPDVVECGLFTEKGTRFQCLRCLGCGLAGGLKLDTGENAVHKVSAVTGLSSDGEIITEARNALEPRIGTVPKWEFLIPEKEKRPKRPMAAYWQSEYVAPGAHFPISLTFRDVAAVEFGLSLTAFDTSWKNIGLGAHKNGRLQGWNENIDSFTLHVWMDSWLQEPEIYRGEELKHIINQAKRAAYIASAKKLLTKYVLDVSKLRGVKTGKERAGSRGG